VQIAWSSFLPAVFYATPIAYTPEIIPEKYRLLIELNPIHHYIAVLRDLIFYNRMPEIGQLLLITGIAGITLWLGLFIFNKLKGGFISQF